MMAGLRRGSTDRLKDAGAWTAAAAAAVVLWVLVILLAVELADAIGPV